MQLGMIGLGRMGRPMAINLVKKGFGLSVIDINPAAGDLHSPAVFFIYPMRTISAFTFITGDRRA